MEELTKLPLSQLLVLGLASMLVSVVMGRTMKRIVYWIIEAIAKKTKWKRDDDLLPDIKNDLNLDK
jgi:hypothetical protein